MSSDGQSTRSFTKLDAMALGADCEHCPLRTAGKLVPSVGTGANGIAFVGEAPGVQEAREGKPFIGPSGRLLKLVAANVGVDKDESFLSNACLCRTPDGKPPPKLAIAACRPRLLRELQRAGTGTVVALGNSACLGLLGTEGVTRLRVGLGRTSPYPELANVRIIPTLHPAACLRQSDMFPSLVRDIGKIGAVGGNWEVPRWRVVDDPLEAIDALREVQSRTGRLVVDIEVDIDKDTASDHPDRYDLLCVGLYDADMGALVVGERALQSPEVMLALGDALRARDLVNQNLMFDLAGLFPHVGALEGVFDTMFASYALDERPGVHDLGQQGIEILGTPDWKHDIDRYVKGKAGEGLEHFHGYGRIPREILYKYNAYDLKVTWDLMVYYEDRLEKVGHPRDWPDSIPYEFVSLRSLHDFLVEVSNEMKYLELNGIYVDWNYNQQLMDSYEDDLEVYRGQIQNLLNEEGWDDPETKQSWFNPNSPQQVKRLMNNHWGFRLESTDEDTMTRIKEQIISKYGDKAYEDVRYNFCDLLLQHRKAAKMYGTYVKGIRRRRFRGKIHASYRLHGTVTGRPAGRNPNLLNIPRMKKIKKQFVPKPGDYKKLQPHNVFVQADMKQAELRTLSWIAQDTYFRDILNDPTRDLFDELTPQLRPDLPPKERVDPELWKDIRVRVKAFVYGLGYGRKAGSIAAEYRMPFDEADLMAKRFFATIPEIAEWQEWVKKRVRGGHDLVTPFGRHRRFHLITEENWFKVQNEALAFLPQSTSSDIVLRAFVRLRREFRGTGVFLRNTVYDSILADCPPDMADWVAERLNYHMVASAQELVGDYIQFATDIEIGNNWGF